MQPAKKGHDAEGRLSRGGSSSRSPLDVKLALLVARVLLSRVAREVAKMAYEASSYFSPDVSDIGQLFKGCTVSFSLGKLFEMAFAAAVFVELLRCFE